MKRILYFFPDDITKQSAGNITRALYLLKYFSERGFVVDFASVKTEKEKNTTEQTEAVLKAYNLAGKVYLLPRKVGKSNPVTYFLKYKIWDLLYYLFRYPLRSNIPTYLTLKLKSGFEEILKRQVYDYVVISYVQCADLVSDKMLLKGAKTIIDTHDFITAQFKEKRKFNLGVTFEDEIKRLNIFDEVWAISPEEQYVFNQFCKPPVRLVTFMMASPPPALTPVNTRKYDLIYIASDNVHNIKSARWFFKEVYPLLPAGLNIGVIGKINNYIDDSYPISRVLFAESLEPYYNDAKIAICPMLQGTGVKIKVVEALAYGLPVVCTSRGTDGLPSKQQNGCLVSDEPGEFAGYITTLLNDEDLYLRQSKLAKELFNNSFNQAVIYKALDASLYEHRIT